MTKRKAFDCVAVKRQGTRRIYAQTKGMTVEQELAFWKRKEAALDHRLKTARRVPLKAARVA